MFLGFGKGGLTMKLKIAVCDDETSIINRLKQFLVCHELQYDDDLIVDYFQSGKELLEAHNNAQYDIIFLDIEMPHVNGLQTATKIRNRTYDNSGLSSFLVGSSTLIHC